MVAMRRCTAVALLDSARSPLYVNRDLGVMMSIRIGLWRLQDLYLAPSLPPSMRTPSMVPDQPSKAKPPTPHLKMMPGSVKPVKDRKNSVDL